jgi:cytochrome P450
MEVLFQMLAGSDTTATAIRATILHIISSPRVYQTLIQEMEDGIKHGAISSPITNDEAKKLPYLQAVIYEGLRINPPFTGLAAKEVPKGGATLNGLFVPGGTRIAHSIWSFLRSRAIFGDDAELFRPERYITADAAKFAEMRNVVELTFGYGKYRCAGQSVAFLELNKVFIQVSLIDGGLLRPFRFDVDDCCSCSS